MTTSRERVVVTCRFLNIEVLRGFLVERRAKLWALLCHRFGNTRVLPHWFGRRLEICFNKVCFIFPPSLASADYLINKLHTNTFDEDNPETTPSCDGITPAETHVNMLTFLINEYTVSQFTKQFHIVRQTESLKKQGKL